MYAILETGGKQYRVQEGDTIYVEKLNLEDGAEVTLESVLTVGDGADLKVGAPYVAGASVTGKVVKTGKGKKVMIFKYKSKKNYRRRQGHRQPYTKLEILSVKG
ncbi:MAG: 50S ribosomal protein L21 [Clostridiales bacterium]|nr:50S ribosomal protein L21 [Clostridiales bacterium]